jgi:hypothetical protein
LVLDPSGGVEADGAGDVLRVAVDMLWRTHGSSVLWDRL